MLFNKDNRGSEELYEISGIFQASTNYRSIAAEIDSATAEVRAIVGDDVMDAAEAAYMENVPDEDQVALMEAVRRPVAYLAISMHAKISGVTHGETGRKLKVDDNEKIPFEWMLDRDDAQLRERYYRALDALFRYLESTGNAELKNSWEHTPTRSRTFNSVIKSLAEVEGVYPIEHSHYMFFRLLPLFIEVQDSQLRKIVGEDKLRKLIDRDPSVDDILTMSMRFIVLKAMVIAVQRWSVDAFPLSIARRFSPSYQGNKERMAATKDEIEWFSGKLNLQAQDVALELQAAGGSDPYEDLSLIPDNDPRNKYFTV